MTMTPSEGSETDGTGGDRMPPAVDVVIVGGGPAGLTLANLLGQAGVRTLVLERDLVPHGQPRAVAVDDEAMRVFQGVGLDDELARDMVMDVVANFVRPGNRMLVKLAPKDRSFWKSAMCFHYQPALEDTLRRGVARFACVEMRVGHLVTGIRQDAAGVTVEYRVADSANSAADPGAAPTGSLRARYVVGCDGGRSTVRSLCGIEMIGEKFPDPWLVVDVKLDSTPRHLPYFNYYCDPERPHLNCPQPNGHHRFEFMLLPGETKEQMERPEVVRRLLSRFVDPEKTEIVRYLVYTFNSLVAERWQAGRVLLAGDAAHMNPQFFGQGMNSGIRDVANLAWKLALVVKGRAAPALFASYQRERVAHYQAMLRISVALGRIVSLRRPAAVLVRNAIGWIIRHTPGLKRYIEDVRFKPTPRFEPGTYVGMPRQFRGPEGSMFIQPTVRTLDGKYAQLDELLGTGFAMIGYGTDPRGALDAAQRAFWDRLGTRYLCAYPPTQRPGGERVVGKEEPAPIEIEDMAGTLDRWFARFGGRFARRRDLIAVIRPDRYVFALVRARDLSQVTVHAMEQLGSGVASAPERKESSQIPSPRHLGEGRAAAPGL